MHINLGTFFLSFIYSVICTLNTIFGKFTIAILFILKIKNRKTNWLSSHFLFFFSFCPFITLISIATDEKRIQLKKNFVNKIHFFQLIKIVNNKKL